MSDGTKALMAPDPSVRAARRMESIPFESRLFSKHDLANYLQVEERTIENWMARRYVPYLKIGGTIRFKIHDVLRHLETHHQVKPRLHRASFRRAGRPAVQREASPLPGEN